MEQAADGPVTFIVPGDVERFHLRLLFPDAQELDVKWTYGAVPCTKGVKRMEFSKDRLGEFKDTVAAREYLKGHGFDVTEERERDIVGVRVDAGTTQRVTWNLDGVVTEQWDPTRPDEPTTPAA